MHEKHRKREMDGMDASRNKIVSTFLQRLSASHQASLTFCMDAAAGYGPKAEVLGLGSSNVVNNGPELYSLQMCPTDSEGSKVLNWESEWVLMSIFGPHSAGRLVSHTLIAWLCVLSQL